MTNTPVYPQGLNNGIQSFVNADGSGSGNAKTLFTPGANGSILDSLLVSSSDTSDRDLTFCLFISSTLYAIATIKIPLTAGTVDTIPTVDILRSLQFPGLSYDAFGNRILKLASGTLLKAYAGSTVTTAKQINVYAEGRDF